MNYRLVLALLLSSASTTLAQKIHAHNDYTKVRPFVEAYEQRADFIEADIWLRNGKLVVSHEKPEESPQTPPTLDSLYLQPIARLFQQYKDKPSSERDYTFALVLDIKENPTGVLPKLLEKLQENLVCFNRSANAKAIQVIISGERPKINTYLDYPLLQFDGRPSEVYDQETLQRVAMISDNFQSYSRWNGIGDIPDADRDKLKRVIKRAHSDNKPFRFWAIPDTPNGWKQLKKLGVDIINTDNVGEAVKAKR
ncbi:phosphatidylinositol-specific phospholipase C/glycerophosphodiester phosphodiesterase family protein [Spirosoma sp.]|uniref:phosphatidylinositol-specific phospholipase C/glycerophosphodiester phosphodiesterase family protein n=1 Tax=Spirosoma sp. TaxID=1899569 RepID=UPI00260C3885|nr:phosphatidylinositol-specific phospholipase C/glycerophosphodiester phosphodiesterase family protein [Spirosoma sp.]MCX6215158.1 phosphatidylinositol-specific phospholipase C/glycerophosphodiester phosphodiesterase family protein [Spirosoma sp.]